MCDVTRPVDGVTGAFAAHVGERLDGYTPLFDAPVILRQQHDLAGCSLLCPEVGAGDPYLGGREVAAFLNVRPRTVNQWRFRRRLPEADLVLRATNLWRRSTILRWAGDTGRLRAPALRAEYEKRWEIEPLPYRQGGRIPEPPKPSCLSCLPAVGPTPANGAATSTTPSGHDVVGRLGDV